MNFEPAFFEERQTCEQDMRPGGNRSQYQRDRARIMHSAAFRRLQGKTQVMGTGEGDFHRTRLTHSIEVAQIGYSIWKALKGREDLPEEAKNWLPDRDLIEASCFAHDLGHPPFGHSGEQALHKSMRKHGGFEGNGQTLRILTKLEKYKEPVQGINPTRWLVLGVLKYPKPMGDFALCKFGNKPPKSFYDEEKKVVKWALTAFSEDDLDILKQSANGKDAHHILNCSILVLADDIAYGIHDIEDIIARGLATDEEVRGEISKAFDKVHGSLTHGDIEFDDDLVCDGLLGSSFERKQMIANLVHLFVTSVRISEHRKFQHPLLRYNAYLPDEHRKLLTAFKGLSYDLIVKKPELQQLEWRGHMIVKRLFKVLIENPQGLIPQSSWKDGCTDSSVERRVCDYIAGMTDSYAEKLYKRLFQPGFGSSRDEL